MLDNSPNATSGMALWALLVGISDYPRSTNLRGCVNDVEAMRIFLVNQLGVPNDHIRTLTNGQATRTGILQAFQQFLIDNPGIEKDDQILFHFSGHGSQMPDPSGVEPDGQNETIVPYDSRAPGVFDIPDKTLAALLDRLVARKGEHITVILDSCHSGSGTRRIDAPNVALTRRIPADERLPPGDLDAELLAGAATRGAGPSGWAVQGLPYVLLAGCRDREESNEYLAPSEEGSAVWHGALTYFTLQALQDLTPNTSYADIHERVATRVNVLYPTQTPQCEGDRSRVVFGGVRVSRDAFIPVREVLWQVVTLGAGLVHGLRPGTELAVYSPHVQTRDNLPQPLATVEVLSVTATTATSRVKDSTGQDIPVGAKGLITKQIYAGIRQKVALHAAEGAENEQAISALRQVIQHAGPGGQPSPYLQILDDPDQAADLRVVAAEGKCSIFNQNGELLVVPEDIQDKGHGLAAAALHSLESIARFRTILALKNEESGSKLAGKVRLRLRRYVEGPQGPQAEDLPPEAVGPGGEWAVYFDPERKERNLLVVDVINESDQPVYPYVFYLSPDYSIWRPYPGLGQQEALRPGGTLTSGLTSGKERIRLYLPDGWDVSRDYLKAVITTQPVPSNLDALLQDGLNVEPPRKAATRALSTPLDQLLDAVLYQAGTRFGRDDETPTAEDWTVAELPLTVARSYRTTRLAPPAGRVALGDGLTLVKPQGFGGQVSVTTWGQATRGVDGDLALRPPPGLAGHPEWFQPLGRPGTRSVGPTGLVVALEVDEASRQSITPHSPLRFELPGAPGEEVGDLLPVAFDGEDYLLVGYPSADLKAVDVVSLPPAVVPMDSGGQPTKRGIGRTIRLFIFKKLGRYIPDLGLRRAELVDGLVQYEAVQRDLFQPGHSVALFLHGFTSDTRWMIQHAAPFLRREVLPYDHCLTFDYETFGTGIEENGKNLALALRQQCGFGPDDEITLHVYAHSMGCLVSRCMIELHGGHQFVDRLVMAGAPNRGTPLANLGRGALYLANVLINRFAVIPPLKIAGVLLEQIYQQGAAAADGAVDSPLQETLNALDQPSNVPYLVLAGRNVLDEQELTRLNRIAKKTLDKTMDALFGEPNDVAVGVSSMRGVRGGGYPNLQVQALPCDHFHYFHIPQGREAVRAWIKV